MRRQSHRRMHASKLLPGSWLTTTMSQGVFSADVTFPCFCYGSNGIEQMRDRCRNPDLMARKARLTDSARVFGGWGKRWGGGAVASVAPVIGEEVKGSIVDLTAEELHLLDWFEGTKSREEPYAKDGCAYYRQDVVVLAGDPEEPVAAVLYIMANCMWQGPPTVLYLDACIRNLAPFWQPASVQIRDVDGQLRDGPGDIGSTYDGTSSNVPDITDHAAASSAGAGSSNAGGAGGSSGVGGSSSAGGGSSSSTAVDEPVTHFDAMASSTVKQLVEVMGFPLDKAVTAVDAIGDKSDVGLALDWLLTHGEEDHGGAVEFVHCPHLDDPSVPLIEPLLLVHETHAGSPRCAHGCVSKEQWVCLQCAGVYCGRYVHKHALAHHQATPTHMTSASLADLSIHCYKCDKCTPAPPSAARMIAWLRADTLPTARFHCARQMSSIRASSRCLRDSAR